MKGLVLFLMLSAVVMAQTNGETNSTTQNPQAQLGLLPPRVLSKVPAQYTPQAYAANIQGIVKLNLVVGEDGSPFNIAVVQSLDPGLDQNAIAAVRQWRFDPGTRNGQPVMMHATIEITFRVLPNRPNSQIPDNATAPAVVDANIPALGATSNEVETLLGKPKEVFEGSTPGEFFWYYGPFNAQISYKFSEGKLVQIYTPNGCTGSCGPAGMTTNTAATRKPSKWVRAAGIALSIAQQLAYQNVCPQVYRKPVIFMNTNELQWLEACNEHGYMLFGLYVFNR